MMDAIRAFSLPLIVGVILAVIWANVVGETSYHNVIEHVLGTFTLFGREVTVTPHWLVNDIFMVFFFGVAAKEITDAMAPGGALNPPSKALNPIMGTLGGVLGPVGVYFAMTYILSSGETAAQIAGGWGIPTATDIALAWLVARVVFGAAHPAVNFLLLLAIADDAIGLMIIAIFYPDPNFPVEAKWLLLTAGGMGLAFGLRKLKVNSWLLYVGVAGVLSWLGLLRAGLHPALALVVILPFMPLTFSGKRAAEHGGPGEDYMKYLGLPVDLGLFFFGLFNAGVAFGSSGAVTWVVLVALLVGKPLGIGGFAWLGNAIGFKYPTGMGARHTFVAGIIAALGLTVALFVSGQAFEGELQSAAKLGALLSVIAAPIAYFAGKALNVKTLDQEK